MLASQRVEADLGADLRIVLCASQASFQTLGLGGRESELVDGLGDAGGCAMTGSDHPHHQQGQALAGGLVYLGREVFLQELFNLMIYCLG
jgi:hypothetical protein